jgi:UDP-N-acetylglucosamine/UDP-N-acetylgalactosamine diphosphorylase
LFGFNHSFISHHLIRYHIAKKKIPYADPTGNTVTPAKENGWKLELFIFDAFQYCNKMVAFEVKREEEFSPLKNGAGMAVPKDSPETCLVDLCRLYKSYVEKSGGVIVGDGLVEVSPLLSYSGEGLDEARGKKYSIPALIE